MTREEHLQWSKTRALQYVNTGDLTGAWASMVSDLGKHDELRDHSAIQLGTMLQMGGFMNTAQEVRKFIEGFN